MPTTKKILPMSNLHGTRIRKDDHSFLLSLKLALYPPPPPPQLRLPEPLPAAQREERLTEREETNKVLVMITIYHCVIPDGRSTAKNVVSFIILVPLAS
jgi:hypothetical protein